MCWWTPCTKRFANQRMDKKRWILSLAGSRDWSSWNKLRKGQRHSQGKLRNLEGGLVSSEQRAETLMQYLEQVQWAVRPVPLIEEPSIFGPLSVSVEPISMNELRRAVNMFKSGKATGPGEVPIEFWKAVLNQSSPFGTGAQWLLHLCNSVLSGRRVPDDWHLQKVAMIFKKGDPAECGNYRPIC